MRHFLEPAAVVFQVEHIYQLHITSKDEETVQLGLALVITNNNNRLCIFTTASKKSFFFSYQFNLTNNTIQLCYGHNKQKQNLNIWNLPSFIVCFYHIFDLSVRMSSIPSFLNSSHHHQFLPFFLE